ncbi:MAG TPA: amidase [Polyangiales bacterium]|nr:amidase [Polyangiales bacterium]
MDPTLELRSATELAAAIAARRISCLELCDACLRRIERLNPVLNAVITLDGERARSRARALDEQLARGELARPLHGLPITIKDAYETAGMRTTCGTHEWEEHVPERDADPVRRLVEAGAVVLGKSNVPAYCSDLQTFNELFGVTRNPWDLTRTPGGSSGGAAAAVASGMTAFELGSDIGGSIRTPCGWSGVYGHKPTHGIVPLLGHLPPAPGTLVQPDLGVGGPIARSAEDLALVLSVIAAPNPAQAVAYRFALPPPRARSLREFRVGAWLHDPDFPLADAVASQLEQTVIALERAGVRVDRGLNPGVPLREIFDDYLALLTPVTLREATPELLERLAQRARAQDDEPRVAHIARAALARHIDWLVIHERRARLSARFAELFRSCDVLLCPITPVSAIAHDHRSSLHRRTFALGGSTRRHTDMMAWISPATACHLPATAAPIGRTREGLPVGVQIVGPYLEDLTPIAFAAQLREVIGGYEVPPNA